MFAWNFISVYLELQFCLPGISFLFAWNFIFVYLQIYFLFAWNFNFVYLEFNFCLTGISILFARNLFYVCLELHFCLPLESFLFAWNFIFVHRCLSVGVDCGHQLHYARFIRSYVGVQGGLIAVRRPTQHMNREMLFRKREIAQSNDLNKVLCSANGTPNKGPVDLSAIVLRDAIQKGGVTRT